MDTEKTVEEKKKSKSMSFYDTVEILAISIVAVVLLFTFVARITSVVGGSMNTTFEDGDKVVVSKLFYTPETGDVIVFQQPDGFFSEPLIKRVIATGGQTLKIDFDRWKVYVDGKELDEDYINRKAGETMKRDNYYSYYAELLDETGTMTIPEGYIFVMGDNRNGSSDSRFAGVGLVSEHDVMGKVIFRLLPLSGIGIVK